MPGYVRVVIENARQFRENNVNGATWRDYERYKRQLVDNGYYGYERELADALRL